MAQSSPAIMLAALAQRGHSRVATGWPDKAPSQYFGRPVGTMWTRDLAEDRFDRQVRARDGHFCDNRFIAEAQLFFFDLRELAEDDADFNDSFVGIFLSKIQKLLDQARRD